MLSNLMEKLMLTGNETIELNAKVGKDCPMPSLVKPSTHCIGEVELIPGPIKALLLYTI